MSETKKSVASATAALTKIVAIRPNGEVRPQQQTMVEHVAEALDGRKHLIVQAGTGTGKSFGYLIPAITSGRRVVVSTATKQLSEQIAEGDLPYLSEHLTGPDGLPVDFALLKGRNNYLCQFKIDELQRLGEADPNGNDGQEELFETSDSRRPSRGDIDALNRLLVWAEDPGNGDRAGAPPCSDKVWSQVSMTSAGCPGAKKCQFGETCHTEAAKAEARDAKIVVTNHALVAADLPIEGGLFHTADAIVFDEAHHLQDYLSRAWGVEITGNDFTHAVGEATRALPRTEGLDNLRERGKALMAQCEQFANILTGFDGGVLEEIPDDLKEPLNEVIIGVRAFAAEVRRAGSGPGAQAQARLESAHRSLDDLVEHALEFANDNIEAVRWIEAAKGRAPAALRTAPLWVGARLQEYLGDRTMVATSATLTVAKSFEQSARIFGLLETPEKVTALDVGTPFDYRTQAMLYIPGANDFPAPVGADRQAHTAAVQEELTKLVHAAGGRTLALFTTRFAAEKAAEHLKKTVSTPILVQGDAPPAALIEQFAADPAATLCATMGFWHGVDVPGESCFPPGTLVRTSRGYRPIETIKVGDRVWTHKRRYRKVTNTMVRDYDGEMVTVTPFGAPPVSMTPEHPVLVSDYARQGGHRYQNMTSQRWVKAGDLTRTDRLVLPIGDWFTGFKPLGRRHTTGHRTASDRQKHQWDDTPEFWELVGLWAAEGSLDREVVPRKSSGAHKVRWSVRFSFGSHEESTLAARCSELIEKVFGRDAPTPQVYGSGCVVRFHNDAFAHWLTRNVGRGASQKRVPTRLLRSYHWANKVAFLDGYGEGDGHTDRRDGSVSASSVSPDLALGVRDLALMCGYSASVGSKVQQAGYKPGATYWFARWQPNRSNLAAMVLKRGSDDTDTTAFKYQVAKPSKIEHEHYTGPVHNLSVDVDESYTLVGFAVHNCSLVVIDKVPFAPMNDPLMSARVDAAKSEGRNGFLDVYVSEAATMIAQGFGRLIRSGTDRGVVAILDTRIHTKGYGSAILGALPEVGLFTDHDKVVGALERLTAAAENPAA